MKPIAAVLLFCLAAAPQAEAGAPEFYSWTGYATGPARCSLYRLTVDVKVEDAQVTGRFGMESRAVQRFDATRTADGAFQAKAEFGSRGPIEITGTLRDGKGEVVLDGFRGNRCVCRFEATLAPVTPKVALTTQ